MTHRVHAVILSFIFIFLLVGYYFFFTSNGLKAVVKLSLSKYAKAREIRIDKIDGNVLLGIKIDGIQINRLKKIPEEVVVKIQHIDLNFHGFNLNDVDLKIKNGRVEIAKTQPIIFGGTYNKRKLDFNIYSRLIDVKSYLWLFSESVILKNATSGSIVEPDFYLRGSLNNNELSGKMIVKMLSFEKYSLLECPIDIKGIIYSKGKKLQVKGDIFIQSGVINLGGSMVKQFRGKIFFTGDPYNPQFDLEGDSVVGGTRIHVVCKGNYLNPELKLTSEPPLPQDDLVVMLFTGNIFKAERESLGAEFKVTDRFSLEGQTQIKKNQDRDLNQDQSNNGKILLKYKDKF